MLISDGAAGGGQSSRARGGAVRGGGRRRRRPGVSDAAAAQASPYRGGVTSPRPALLAACAAGLLLSGCAVVHPPSTVPPTGWPEPSRAAATASASAAPGARPAAPSPTASDSARSVAKGGVRVPLPPGYLDVTDLVTDAPSAGSSVQLVALLRNPVQHLIFVQRLTTDQRTLAGFVDFYVTAQNAGSESAVIGRRGFTMGGRPGVELTLKSKTDGRLSSLFAAMPQPGTLVMVTGASPDEATRKALEQVAGGLSFS